MAHNAASGAWTLRFQGAQCMRASLCREQVYFPPGQLWEGSHHGHCRHLAVAGLQSEGSVPAGRLAAALWRPGLQLA